MVHLFYWNFHLEAGVQTTATQSTTLLGIVRQIAEQLSGEDLHLADMSRAGSLELDRSLQAAATGSEADHGEIRRLEGAIEARVVERHEGSPIRYFLDGSQMTLPVWRVGTVPVIAAVSAAAILYRHSPDDVGIVPGTLMSQVAWITPRYTTHPALNRLVAELEMLGERIIDPLESVHRNDPGSYNDQIGLYTHTLERSYDAAKTHREAIEAYLLGMWQRDVRPTDPTGWIVADGRLRSETRNAIGLVKDVQAQHVFGDEAVALYDLPAGHRTTAYTLVDEGTRQDWDRAMWYLRMQNATGMDARHGLIRLETPMTDADLDLIEHISSWILAERAPRASSDARWATLLYPIHLLERMLKRRIQTITAGWPA